MTPEKTDLIEVRQQLNLYPETLLYLLLSPGNQVLISTPSWAPWPEVLDFTPWPRILCPPIYTCDLLFMTTEPTLDLRHLLMDICFNRPGVTRDVLQTPSSLINSFNESSFSSHSSKHHYSQTIRAMDLDFLANIHRPMCVMCHMSRVTCHMSHTTGQVLHITCRFGNCKKI